MNTEFLKALDKNNELNTLDFSKSHGVDHQNVVGTLKSLEALEKVVSEVKSCYKLVVTDEGSKVALNGSYEYQIYSNIPTEGIKREELIKVDNGLLGFNKAMSLKWIHMIDCNGEKLTFKKIDVTKDQVSHDLRAIEKGVFNGDTNLIKEYKKRQLVKDVESKYFIVKKGPKFSLNVDESKQISVLTKEIIEELSDDIINVQFKDMNMAVFGNRITNANRHPTNKLRSRYVEIFVAMNFQEMPTNSYVESSFWNFDALFQPQDHPARDAHDTFFVSEPATSDNFPNEYLHRVKQVHSCGGYGSQGYKNPWKIEEAQKNLMRTHTTAASARMLYRLAQQKEFTPVKYFSIDRVFRNETLDATHLAEFHQVEGLIAGRDLSLHDLIETIRSFFHQLGLDKIKFKPAYNPYTEPSMEIFGYHEGLGKWIELGNSGMFRPEMLLPMGLPEDVVVIAWGLSLERPAMIKYGYNDIRDMMGPKINMAQVFTSPICLLDR